MRKIILFGAIILLSSLLVSMGVRKFSSDSGLLVQNIEALTSGESTEEDGALYYAEGYNLMCCGPGNVRSCSGYVECDF